MNDIEVTIKILRRGAAIIQTTINHCKRPLNLHPTQKEFGWLETARTGDKQVNEPLSECPILQRSSTAQNELKTDRVQAEWLTDIVQAEWVIDRVQ